MAFHAVLSDRCFGKVIIFRLVMSMVVVALDVCMRFGLVSLATAIAPLMSRCQPYWIPKVRGDIFSLIGSTMAMLWVAILSCNGMWWLDL